MGSSVLALFGAWRPCDPLYSATATIFAVGRRLPVARYKFPKKRFEELAVHCVDTCRTCGHGTLTSLHAVALASACVLV